VSFIQSHPPHGSDVTTTDNGKRSENFGRKAMGLKPLFIIGHDCQATEQVKPAKAGGAKSWV